MRTRRLVFSIFVASIFLSVGCSHSNGGSGVPAGASLLFSGPTNFVAYRCVAFTVSAVDANGAPFNVPFDLSVALNGLGLGEAYASLSDCQKKANASDAVFIAQGQSSETLYFRTDAAGTDTLTALNAILGSVSLTLTSSLFQVLGQAGPTTCNAVWLPSATALVSPGPVFSDGTHLLAADGSRVLVWKSMPAANDAPADFALGQPDIEVDTANAGGISAHSLALVGGIYSDGTKLIIADKGNNRVLFWRKFPVSGTQDADIILGQGGSALTTSAMTVWSGMSSPSAVWSDGTHLFVADSGNHRVLIWNTIPTSSFALPDVVLGQSDFGSGRANKGAPAPDADTLSDPSGIVTIGSALYVSDSGNGRILVWNSLPSANGAPADLVLGQQDFVHGLANQGEAGGTSAFALSAPGALSTDGSRLLVADGDNNRVVGWSSVTASNQPADFVLGQSDFTSLLSPSSCTPSVFTPTGISVDAGTRVFISDSANARVLVLPLP